MKIIKKVEVTYEDCKSDRKIEDVDKLIDENRMVEDEFDYFFELHEDDEVVVFANLAGYDLDEGDIESGYGRVFQIETAVLVKDDSTVYYLGDNNGFKSLSFLNDIDVWTTSDFRNIGITVKGSGVPHKYKQLDWYDYKPK